MFYSIEIIFKKKSRGYHSVKILDSLKIIPFSVEAVAKTYGLPIKKLEIDWKKYILIELPEAVAFLDGEI